MTLLTFSYSSAESLDQESTQDGQWKDLEHAGFYKEKTTTVISYAGSYKFKTILKSAESVEQCENSKVELIYRKHSWPCDPTASDYVPKSQPLPQIGQRVSAKQVRFLPERSSQLANLTRHESDHYENGKNIPESFPRKKIDQIKRPISTTRRLQPPRPLQSDAIASHSNHGVNARLPLDNTMLLLNEKNLVKCDLIEMPQDEELPFGEVKQKHATEDNLFSREDLATEKEYEVNAEPVEEKSNTSRYDNNTCSEQINTSTTLSPTGIDEKSFLQLNDIKTQSSSNASHTRNVDNSRASTTSLSDLPYFYYNENFINGLTQDIHVAQKIIYTGILLQQTHDLLSNYNNAR